MFTLKAQSRNLTGKKVRTLRQDGIIPAVIYGHNFPAQNIQVTKHEFEKVYKKTGESSLIDLKIDEHPTVKALVYDIQYHPLTDTFQHIDFYRIKAGEKITVEVELKFVGTPPAVKELGGVFVVEMDKLEIECLPDDLVHEIEVDVSGLKNFDDLIRVKDLKVPEKIKVLQDPETMVAAIERPIKEEIPEQAPEAKIEEVKVVGEEAKEGEEGKEKEEKKIEKK